MAGVLTTSSGRPNLDWTRGPTPTMTTHQQTIRNIDWSRTSLGSMQTWQRELRQIVLFMMAEFNPAILYWGESHTILYNEAHIPLLGKRHPELLGMNASDAFPEFWQYFADVMAEQRLSGQCRVGEAKMLLVERHGFLEETYCDWKLIPVIGDDGTMLGGYGVPAELSGEVINSRRVACLNMLTQLTHNSISIEQLWRDTMLGLSHNEKDIPLAMLYSVEQESNADTTSRATVRCNREAVLGIPELHPIASKQIDIKNDQSGLAPIMLTAFQKGAIHSVSISDAKLEPFCEDIEWRGFGIPVQELVCCPIDGNGSTAAILVLGLNPRQRFSEKYHTFVQSIGNVVSPQISKLRLAAEVESRDQIARSAALDFQRVQNSEMKFSRFAERSPIGLGLTTKDGKLIYANDAWNNFIGLDCNQVDSPNWIEEIYEDDLPLINDWWNKVVDHKQSGTFQLRTKMPFINGEVHLPFRTGLVALYPDLDENGDVATVMGLVMDISELKWTEQQLRLRQKEIEASEKNYREFAELAPIGVIRTDYEGNVLFTNEAWRLFYNFDKDHKFTEPEPWLSSINKEDVPLAYQFFRDIRDQKKVTTVEVRLQRPKSTLSANRSLPAEYWLLSSGFAESNPDGSIANVTFWVTDISDQKAAEKILTAKMEEAIRLRNTQERFVDMISHEIRNPLSAILHCGEEIVEVMKTVLGNKMSTTQSLPRDRILSGLDAANTIMYCVQHQKQIVDDVLTLSKLDADLLVVSPIPVQPADLIASAMKIFEPELKASSIELAFEIGPSLDELKVDWVMLDPNRFLQIIINLLTNAIKFTKASDVRRIVINVAAREDKPPPQYQGVHYVPRREVEDGTETKAVQNSLDQDSPQDLYLCFSVTDTGKGLTKPERNLLFERFAQASPKTHIEYGGSGLGLFISRQITEMLGGEIGVGSEPGKGAVFAFYVCTRRVTPPLRANLESEPLATYADRMATSSPITHATDLDGIHTKGSTIIDSNDTQQRPGKPCQRRILVVEDNLVNQKVLCKQLRNRGFFVDAANHGREALDILEKVQSDRASHFDIILCDIEMPIMDGLECVTEIRRLEKEGTLDGHIPIIGVTANVRSKQVNAAIEVGMDSVTTKPYRIDDLIEHMERVFA